jgi:hypothetical protein
MSGTNGEVHFKSAGMQASVVWHTDEQKKQADFLNHSASSMAWTCAQKLDDFLSWIKSVHCVCLIMVRPVPKFFSFLPASVL